MNITQKLADIEFLKGDSLKRRLGELKEAANSNHTKAASVLKKALDHARQAGEALCEAKKRLGGRGKWTRWLRDNFEASIETARVYMRVARTWDDERVAAARQGGMAPESIATFLDVVKGTSPDKGEKPILNQTPEESDQDYMCSAIRQDFGKKLRSLKIDELRVMFEAGFAPFWASIRDVLVELAAAAAKEEEAELSDDETRRQQLREKRRKRRRKNNRRRQVA